MPHSSTIQALQELLKERITLQSDILITHSKDLSWHPAYLPDAVCYPINNEEVAAILKICNAHKTPVIPFGTGTSLEGHILPISGGITVNLSKMNRILDFNEIDQDCRVEAGVTKFQLNSFLKDKGLFFAAGPGIDASMGGMMASGASGANAVMYGTVKENVRSLKVVMADGKIVTTRRRVRKSSAGYDLTQLFVGSEGTLGIITEVTAVLHSLPQFVAVAVVPFPSIEEAIEAAIQLNQSDLQLAMLELMDEVIMDAINRYSQTDYPVQPTLFLELHSRNERFENQYSIIQKITQQHQAIECKWATEPAAKEQLFKARYDAVYAIKALQPEAVFWSSDVTVPISRLAEIILKTKIELEKLPLHASLFGHVGDGNFHTLLLFKPDNEEELNMVKAINHQIVLWALEMEGTCTGEHGIGIGKKDYLQMEFGESGMELMKTVKKAFDPNGIMNPGKIV
ncbi:MAG: FAD-linked oxidase C-terminal domain-containing protein [Chitinophagales bacterium]